MPSLTNIEIGSIVYNMISNIPVGISGLLINGTLVNQEIYFAEQFVGDVIGTTVSEMYQPAIISLTAANVMELMDAQGVGNKSLSIGDLSVNAGDSDGSSQTMRNNGINKLKAIGERMSFYQAWG